MRALRLLAACCIALPLAAQAPGAAPGTRAPAPAAVPADSVVRADTSRPKAATDLFGPYADLGIALNGRLESRLNRTRNERCVSSQYFTLASQCHGTFQPNFDFQFDVKTGGVVADRVHLNVDYDSKREFDASNNIQVYYQGKSGEVLQKLEVGNVTFQPPTSRFMTSGIPSGNYGLQAIGQVGPMRFRAIVAQQKGNVSEDRIFTVGSRTVQAVDREIEDYQVEPRRFFFTVDPQRFSAFPNIDILNATQLQGLAASLPDTVRPSRLFLYRQLIGGQPPNPNGPQFRLLGDPNSRRGQIYELLRENVDYYTDPSLLWVALVRPLNVNNERLVVAYTVRLNGRDTTITSTGGTPDSEYAADHEQFANLLWDPQVRPADAAFQREIRSVYRVGGEDIRLGTMTARIVTGPAGDQEKPLAGTSETWLQLFGLAQPGNSATFDIDNRLFPRAGDPNYTVGGAAGTRIVRDNFLIFPSLRPFARTGLALPAGNPSNEDIYTIPGEYLYSAQHPQSIYRIRLRYDAEGGADAGSLALGSVQVRPNSERLTLDGVLLRRDVDYRVDYDLGRVTFVRPDTLFPSARQVSVRYEENPLFAAAPTSIMGFASQFPLDVGEINVMAIAQNQRTTFTRPPLGYEPQRSLLAGVSGTFDFNAAPLTRALQRLPFAQGNAPSRVHLDAEVATSLPQANSAGQAYLESFEGEGGTQVALSDPAWYYSSQPALGRRIAARLGGASALDVPRAATMAWQNNGLGANGQPVAYTLLQIDPQVNIIGTGLTQPEPMLWLTLYPLSVGGAYNASTKRYDWQVSGAPAGRRWRSIRTPLGVSGTDLSRVENIQFWTLIDTAAAHRARNPTLVLDFGDVSENSVALAPTQLTVSRNGAVTDTLYKGRTVVGLDSLNSERDAFSRAFNQERDDNGLPGDVVPRLPFTSPDSSGVLKDFPMCQLGEARLNRLGDTRTNCTVRNGRLDEEDIDADNALNFDASQRESERLLRYVVDLADPKAYTRVGTCGVTQVDSAGGSVENNTLCWVFVRLPFSAPYDTVGGGPSLRRVRALRLTVVSGVGQRDDAFTQLPLALFKLTGAAWLKRSDHVLTGIAGAQAAQGAMQASTIGTMDRDSSGFVYDSPPGVTDAPDQIITGLENQRVQINERSMRITAQRLAPFQRAEAYQRFPEGSKNFIEYRELRVWARGRGNGWGEQGEMQFFVRLGRDADNFYLYRTPVAAGTGQAAWLPEVRVDFEKFFALRAQLQNAFLQNRPDSLACHGADSVLIARSGLPNGVNVRRYAACSGGYMVYTVDPNISAPNLAAVQDMAVGMVRVDSGGTGATQILPTDTLELWVDDIRLTGVDNTPGYAAQVGLSLTAGDVGTFRMNFSHRDPNFRQLNETPSYVSDNRFDVGTVLRLDKLLPQRLGLALPLVVNHSRTANNPFFVSRSDLRGDGIEGLRTPKSAVSTVALSMRRTEPLRDGWLAPIVNNLGATANYGSANSRSEYQSGKSTNLNASVDYNIASPARLRPLPRWMDGTMNALPDWMQRTEWVRALRGSRLRWNPSGVRFSSALARASDHRLAYLKPAEALSDTGRAVNGLTHVWRNVAGLELQPFEALSARWDFTSLRDLRQYGDSSPTAVVATAERNRILGLDVGLERERQMNTAIGFAPTIAFWLRPRIDFTSAYAMQVDPNSSTLVRDADSTGGYHLPRRINNTNTATIGANIDLPAALRAYFHDSLVTPTLVRVLQPIDVQASRSLVSAFAGAPFTPGLGYQLGWGGIDHFRTQNGLNATSAGSNSQVTLSSGLRLPLGMALTARMQRMNSRNWTRRYDNSQAIIDGQQVTLPDVTLRMTLRPRFASRVITNIGGNLRYLNTRQSSVVPSELAGTPPDVRVSRVNSWPLNGSITWNVGTGLLTSFGMATTHRLDSLPGSIAESRSRDLNADVSRAFRMPASWKLKNDVRTRLSYQQGKAEAFVQNQHGVATRSRLADNGRQAINLNADADVAENLTFSLTGARIVTFDNNLNRRFSQLVFTAVLQISFFAGEIR